MKSLATGVLAAVVIGAAAAGVTSVAPVGPFGAPPPPEVAVNAAVLSGLNARIR